MLHLDIPSLAELRALNAVRAEGCVSISLPTTPLTQQAEADRIALRNLVEEALAALETSLDKRRLGALSAEFGDLLDDDAFWRVQARSLVVLADPDRLRTFRLPNRLSTSVEVADRFRLTPLLRAVTFPHEAFVLQLGQNAVRLVHLAPDLPPVEVPVAGMPTDAASAAGKASIADRAPKGRIQGSEGRKVLLTQYARKVDQALRPLLAGRETPLILAAGAPLDAIFRGVCACPGLVAHGLAGDQMPDGDLAAQATTLLDELHRADIARLMARFDHAAGRSRATGDLSDAARAATFGAIDTLIVDMDRMQPGVIDEETGALTFRDAPGPDSYDVIDEIAGRALATGARVLSARADDIPTGTPLAAFLRAPI